MNGLQQRKLNKYQAEKAYMTDNAADFPKDSPGDKEAKRLAEAVSLIEMLAGRQSSQAVRQHIGIKSEALERLTKLLQKMNRAANALGEEVDGIENLFRLPRRRSEEIRLAVGRAFYADSAACETGFVKLDLPAGFRADLRALIEAIERASFEADVAEEQRGGATGALIAAFRDAGKLSRRLMRSF